MMNPLLVQCYQASGTTTTPLPQGEACGVLQTGIIQVQENPGFFLESTSIHEETDVITCIGHNSLTTAVMANKQFFDGLPEEDRQAINESIDAASAEAAFIEMSSEGGPAIPDQMKADLDAVR